MVSFKNHLLPNYDIFVSSLSSLLRFTNYPNFEICIIDYGTIALPSIINKIKFTCDCKIKLIETRKDRGLADRRNLALKAGCECGAKYIVMLDDDVVITDPEWLYKLVHLMEKLPRAVVAVQPLLLEENGKGIAGGLLYRNATTFCLRISEELRRKKVWQTFITAGGFFIVRRSYIEEIYATGVEPYTRLFWMQSEDTDFQIKIYLRGHQSAGTAVASALHIRREKSPLPPWRTYLQYRNRVLLLLLHFSRCHIIKYIMFRFLQDALNAIVEYSRKSNVPRATGVLLLIKAYKWIIINLRSIFKTRAQIQKLWRRSDDKYLEKILLPLSLPLSFKTESYLDDFQDPRALKFH
jgi:GT2 family glycosyltransferase